MQMLQNDTTHARSEGDNPRDWELYEFRFEDVTLRPKTRNTLMIELLGSYAIRKSGGALKFDFLEFLQGDQAIWSIGREDSSDAEFTYRTSPVLGKLRIDRKTNTPHYKVTPRRVEQDPACFPKAILDKVYRRTYSRLIIEF